MNKAVMISIHPKWCELIADGKKTVEVRKTRPKIDIPFKCYIYETKGKTEYPTFIDEEGHEIYEGRGQVIGEFVCDNVSFYNSTSMSPNIGIYYEELKGACLTQEDYQKYLSPSPFYKYSSFYAWHISNLRIYDKPKELKKFRLLNGDLIEKAPQSWCYVKEIIE